MSCLNRNRKEPVEQSVAGAGSFLSDTEKVSMPMSCKLLNHLDQVVPADKQNRNADENRHKQSRHCYLLSYATSVTLAGAIRVHHSKIGISMSENMSASFLSCTCPNNSADRDQVPVYEVAKFSNLVKPFCVSIGAILVNAGL